MEDGEMASISDITVRIDDESMEILKKTVVALECYVSEHKKGYWRRLIDAIMGR